jgi:hypothetical protein
VTTIAELIAQLQECDPAAEVLTSDCCYGPAAAGPLEKVEVFEVDGELKVLDRSYMDAGYFQDYYGDGPVRPAIRPGVIIR